MKRTALVSLDCETGFVRRYLRGPRNKPEETGRAQFSEWDAKLDEPDLWAKVADWLRAFRADYCPPEDTDPRPTSPIRVANAA